MPLPISVLTMEVIARYVDRWRKSELTTHEALQKIEEKIIALQKMDEWRQIHGGG